ncbi:MFS general substrate transporter [Rhodocollybia butyracea]|uniref:MFS general substrate transporter n=1 Tax=Rhodocollybia butyracea TaxID=206335 RepID=A0A9P5Q8F9_9AGAR|nr:MFS general substrate transporter [Rhodocollybia butyracea]
MKTMSSPEFADTSSRSRITVEWSYHEESSLVRKIDTRCLPALVILFILNFLVRGSLANARLKGLQSDLNLSDTEYSTCISILFAGYIFMQVPGNLVMNTIPKPRLFMATVVSLWGAISALTSLCQDFSHLVVCRFFLGFVEAAFYPCAVYYLSRWYTRKELGFRIALLNAGNMLAQGLGGLLAAGILSGMEGARASKAGDGITVAFGLLLPFILADYPSRYLLRFIVTEVNTIDSSTSWLSDRERFIAQGRLVVDVGLIDNPEDDEKSGAGILSGLWLAITDLKVWILAFMYFTYIMGLSFAAYMPTITGTLGFSTTITLLLTFPPWAFATLYALVNSWNSDRTGEKFFHLAGSYGFAILGYIVALTSKTVAGKYVSLFGMCMGFSGGIITLGWISTSLPRPPIKRAASIAFINAFANIGQIPTSYLWPTKWGRHYWQSFVTEICLMVLSLSIAFAYRQYLVSENKKLDRGEIEAYITDKKTVERSAELVHASTLQEEALVNSFRYIY